MTTSDFLKDIKEVDDEDDSTTSGLGSKGASSGSEAVPVLAQRETRNVNRSKACVYLVILVSAALVGALTYWFMETEEKEWYEDEFEEFSEEVFETSQYNLIKLEEATQTLASSWTAHATHGVDGTLHHATYNTTLPNFGLLASHLGSLGRTSVTIVAPILQPDDVAAFEEYAFGHQTWIAEDLAVASFETIDSANNAKDQDTDGLETDVMRDTSFMSTVVDPGQITPVVRCVENTDDMDQLVTPIWQMTPTPRNASESLVMHDLQCQTWFPPLLKQLLATRQGVFSPMLDLQEFLSDVKRAAEGADDDESEDELKVQNEFDGKDQVDGGHHYSLYAEPVYSSFDKLKADVIGVALVLIDWDDYFTDVLEDEAAGLIMDLQYVCPGSKTDRFAFEVTEEKSNVVFLGHNISYNREYLYMAERNSVTSASRQFGDSSDDENEDYERRLQDAGEEYNDNNNSEDNPFLSTRCDWFVTTVVDNNFVEHWQRNDAIIYTGAVVGIFLFTALVFLMYDCMVQRRNQQVMKTAQKSNAIVSSLFPKKVAEQMMEEANHNSMNRAQATQKAFRNFNSSGSSDLTSSSLTKAGKPIADLFRDTTIMFADIAGFTAWSSMREPGQVFTLLETIFNAFDKIADKKKVFKVETVGDCYVSVCGLPDENKDHALIMCSFARECLTEMGRLTKQLEWDLGPDTSILNMRFGLHSGPVTAGVLRGRRARFQLFGDTVNKASRIETSGMPGRIHLSKETADLLIARGKGHWVQKREDAVSLKGLGNVNTYWLNFKSDDGASITDITSEASVDFSLPERLPSLGSPLTSTKLRARKSNLVRWHKEVLSTTLKKIIALRQRNYAGKAQPVGNEAFLSQAEMAAAFGDANPSNCINFPLIDTPVEGTKVELDPIVEEQLGRYVMDIADTYNPNPFHNVEHASHVALSVTKLLSHMESSSELSLDDPMTQFVVILTALIHDADHPGVGNEQLVKEGHPLSQIYPGSIAERHSLETAWQLLHQDCYFELRRAIYSNVVEFEHFRQLLVHSVLVTDIMDRSLQKERKERWEKVFCEDRSKLTAAEKKNLLNLQKTAVLETIIQVSDVSHTMQHWKVYQKWNHRLYYELKKAYEEGRSGKDPSEFWFEGELGFYDFYIIPLAERLKECPAFYTSGRELLLYAISNRKEWETKGKEVLESL